VGGPGTPPFWCTRMSSVRYGIRLGDLKENWFLLFSKTLNTLFFCVMFADIAKAVVSPVELLQPSSKLLKLHAPSSTCLVLIPGSADETEATRAAVHSHMGRFC